MKYHLAKNNLKITIDSKGAELSSVLFNNHEYLWQAKADVWPRHAPVLFPIVGKLKENLFTYNGRSYSLSQHGFARDLEFECISQSETRIEFVLRSQPKTLENYPFDFELILSYEIDQNSIICGYCVKNKNSQEDMFFSIGAHPGFKIPLFGSETWSDYQLHFEKNKNYQITKLQDGLLSDKKIPLQLINSTLNITDHMFENDALVFEDGQIEQVSIISTKTNMGVEINCNNWPFFGIWSKKGCTDFICLEPWHGIADDFDSKQDLTTKKGIIKLTPLQGFTCSYNLRVF